MIKFLLAFLLMVGTASATVVSGTIVNASQAVQPQGYVTFSLAGCPMSQMLYTNSLLSVTTKYTFTANSLGVWSGTVVGNDLITCPGNGATQYIITQYTSTRSLINSALYTLVDASNFNLSTASSSVVTHNSAVTDPLVAQGDIIVGGINGVPTRLPVGNVSTCLASNGITPYWTTSCGSSGGSGGGNATISMSVPSDFAAGTPLTGSGTLSFSWVTLPASTDVPNAIVERDSSGNVSVNAIMLGTTNPTGYQAASANYVNSQIASTAISSSLLGQPNGVATLDTNGMLPVSELSSIAIDRTYVVTTQAAMLALNANVGDVAILNTGNDLTQESYILQVEPATTLSNWIQLLTPTLPDPVSAGTLGQFAYYSSSGSIVTGHNITSTDLAGAGTLSNSVTGNASGVQQLFTLNEFSNVMAGQLVALAGEDVALLGRSSESALGIADANGAPSTTVLVDILGGPFTCLFDGTPTAGDFVTISSTVTADCHDTGISSATPLSLTDNFAKIGVALQSALTNGGAQIYLFGPNQQGSAGQVQIIGASPQLNPLITAGQLLSLTAQGLVPTSVGGTSFGIAITSGVVPGQAISVATSGGPFNCNIDNNAVEGDYVTVGTTTAGTCEDTGQSVSGPPTFTGAEVGVFLTSGTAGGTAQVIMTGPFQTANRNVGISSVVNNNGISYSLSGSTATLGLGAITPTNVVTSGSVSASGNPLAGGSFAANIVLMGEIPGNEAAIVTTGTNSSTFGNFDVLPMSTSGIEGEPLVYNGTTGTMTGGGIGFCQSNGTNCPALSSAGIATITPNNGLTYSLAGSTATLGLGAITPTSITTTGTVSINSEASGVGFLTIGQATTTNPLQLLFSSNTSTNAFNIQSVRQGLAYEQLNLNPNGGSVTIGGTLNIYEGAAVTQTMPSMRFNAGSGNFIMNGYGTGAVYLGWDAGSGGVNFGNGASGTVASVSSAGVFSGTGVVSSGAVSAPYIFSTGSSQLPGSYGTQGAYMLWNYNPGGTGGTNFVNLQGGGTGGFTWQNGTNTSSLSQIMVLSPAGLLNAISGAFNTTLTVNGASVSTMGGAVSCANITFGSGAGTGAVCDSVLGHDNSHIVNITLGSSPSAVGIIFTFTPTIARSSYCIYSPIATTSGGIYPDTGNPDPIVSEPNGAGGYSIVANAIALGAGSSGDFTSVCP